MVSQLPSGTVTLLFTDIEGSSALWDAHRGAMATSLRQHHQIVRGSIESHRGTIVKDKGDGFFAVFEDATNAVEAALDSQYGLRTADWPPETGELLVRMAIHTGHLDPEGGDYHGPAVNKVARLEGLAHGGQVVLSESTTALVRDALRNGVSVIDLGPQRLRGLERPERVHQLVAPNLRSEFPPPRSPGRATVALPDFPTSFFGRTGDMEQIGLMLETNRIVTLLGAGGIGKTRLAVETAATAARDQRTEPAWVDLTSVSGADEVAGAIAYALGVHPEGTASLIDLIADAISEPQLLVLDNFEHVQDAAPVVAKLLAAAPSARVLVTSRTPLRIRGEQIYEVEPLAADGGEQTPAAVALFYDRAASHGVTLAVEGPEAEAVRAICRRLGGLPLAIELVVARIRLMDVRELSAQLERSLDILGSGAADLPARQRTIRSTIDWSLQALTSSQRLLFAQLSVFPAGATFEQLEWVSQRNALDDLMTLVDNSLVHVDKTNPGPTRYRQLVLLRDYAAEILRAEDNERETMSSLVEFYLATAPTMGLRLQHDGSAEKEIRADHSNMAWAMRWAADHERIDEMAEAQSQLWIYWFNGDLAERGAQWVQKIDGKSTSPYVDWLAGLFSFQAGDYANSASRLTVAAAGFKTVGDLRMLAVARTFLGMLTEDPEEGVAILEDVIGFFESVDAGGDLFLPRLFISGKYIELGDLSSALDTRLDLLEWSRETNYPVMIAWSRWNLALALLASGDIEAAAAQTHEAFDQMVFDSYLEGIASGAEVIAIIEIDRGRTERGLHILGACESIWESIGAVRWPEAEFHVKRVLEAVRREADAAQVAGHLAFGRQMSTAELIDLVQSASVAQ